jgi:hypothetical protein
MLEGAGSVGVWGVSPALNLLGNVFIQSSVISNPILFLPSNIAIPMGGIP